MTIEYKWEFPSFITYVEEHGQKDVVAHVKWRLTGTDDAGYSYTLEGGVNIPYMAGPEFIDFNSLTKETVQSWVESSLGASTVAELKNEIAVVVDNERNPKIVTVPPPWTKKEQQTLRAEEELKFPIRV